MLNGENLFGTDVCTSNDTRNDTLSAMMRIGLSHVTAITLVSKYSRPRKSILKYHQMNIIDSMAQKSRCSFVDSQDQGFGQVRALLLSRPIHASNLGESAVSWAHRQCCQGISFTKKRISVVARMNGQITIQMPNMLMIQSRKPCLMLSSPLSK